MKASIELHCRECSTIQTVDYNTMQSLAEKCYKTLGELKDVVFKDIQPFTDYNSTSFQIAFIDFMTDLLSKEDDLEYDIDDEQQRLTITSLPSTPINQVKDGGVYITNGTIQFRLYDKLSGLKKKIRIEQVNIHISIKEIEQ